MAPHGADPHIAAETPPPTGTRTHTPAKHERKQQLRAQSESLVVIRHVAVFCNAIYHDNEYAQYCYRGHFKIYIYIFFMHFKNTFPINWSQCTTPLYAVSNGGTVQYGTVKYAIMFVSIVRSCEWYQNSEPYRTTFLVPFRWGT